MNILRRCKRSSAVVAVALMAVFAVPAIAHAAGDPIAPVAVAGDSTIITITPPVWTIVTGLLLPFLIAAVMKASASKTFKAVVAIIVAAVAALVERATLADGSAVFSSGALLDILAVYGPQLLSYLGLYQHFNINGRIAPTKGLG